MKNYFGLFLLLVLLAGCASRGTTVSSSWHDKESTVTAQSFNKIVVLAMTDDDGQRRQAEDSFASILGGSGIPSYTVLSESVSKINLDKAVKQLEGDGYDGAMVVRLVNSSTSGYKRSPSVRLRPNMYYNFGGNFSAGVGLSINPGSNNQNDEYEVGTAIYKFPSEDLVWSTVTTTSNPTSYTDLLKQVKSKVSDQMEKDGFK